MQPIEFADILSTDLQLAHTGYLTHALCLEGTATLLFNGASFPLQRGDYRTHRDIAYYADQLCVTPKYLSETCKTISGSGAAYWINRYTSVEIARLLRDRSLTLTDLISLPRLISAVTSAKTSASPPPRFGDERSNRSSRAR